MTEALPQSWQTAEIGSVAAYVQRGKSPQYIESSDLPVINQKCIRWHGIEAEHLKFVHPDQWESWSPERFVVPGDILWNSTGTGTIGRAALFAGVPGHSRAVVDSHVTIVRTHPDISSCYLHYFIMSPIIQRRIDRMQSGSTNQVELNRKEVLRTPVPIPPANEQRRIVAKIEALMAHSARAKEVLDAIPALLDRYRQSVLAAAFRGDLTADWRAQHPDVEPASQLLERVMLERRERWQNTQSGKSRRQYKEPGEAEDQSTLPQIPHTWTWITLGHLAWSVKDGPHFSPTYTKIGIPFITGGNVRPDGVNFQDVKYISDDLHRDLSKRCKPELGDILYTKGGTTGIARVNTYKRDFNVWVHVAVLKCVRLVRPFFIQHALNSPFCYEQSQKFTHGVGNQDLGLTRMTNIILPLAPIAEQKEMVRIINYYLKIIDKIEGLLLGQFSNLDQLNGAILHKAFRGELIAQDPNDEPASALLARIKAERAASGTPSRRGGRRNRAAAPVA